MIFAQCVRTTPLLLVSLTSCTAGEAAVQARDRGAQASVLAFEGVNVVPMDRERAVAAQTVVVTGDRITTLGPAGRVNIPKGARRVDGRGKYLLPGLADLHVHFMTADDMTLYVANGVTTVLDMGSYTAVTLKAWRDSVRAGKLLGPDVYVSFFADNPRAHAPMTTVDDARAAVAIAKRDGFDIIKAYNSLTAEQFATIIEEAKKHGLAVIGHGVRSAGLERGFEMGQVMVAHAEEYIYTTFRGQKDSTGFADAVAFTKRTGAYVLPNLSAYDVIMRQWANRPQVDSFLASPEARYLDRSWRERWRRADYVTRPGSLGDRIVFLKRLTKRLSDAGVPLLLGTDSPGIPGMYPGWSIHYDMRMLRDAGLTPWQVLSAGTRTAGEFVKRYIPNADTFGTIAPGSRADLILVDGNPLTDLGTVAKPLGVMVRGRWLPRAELDSLLEAIARKNAGP